MQCVVLAAGQGVRMRPLTLTTPKPLVKLNGVTLLDHIFTALPDEITEAVIVVGYLSEQIKTYCGECFHGRPIQYVEGSNQGSAYSFLAARSLIVDDRFLFLYGDEFPLRTDIVECLRYPSSVLCWEAPDPWNHGVAVLRPDGTIEKIVEKPRVAIGNLITDGVMVLPKQIFNYNPIPSVGGEFFLTHLVNQLVHDVSVTAVRSIQGIGGISTMADVNRLDYWLKHKDSKI